MASQTSSGIAVSDLLSFKAGHIKMTSAGDGKWRCEPDLRKGQVSISADSTGFMFFQWKLRSENNKTLLSIPLHSGRSYTFCKVDTKVTSDRVYLLKGGGMTTPHFFWMQDADSSADAKNCERMQNLLSAATSESSEPGNFGRPRRQLVAEDVSRSLQAMFPSRSTNANDRGIDEDKTDKSSSRPDRSRDGGDGPDA